MVANVGIIYNKPDGEIRSIVVPDSDLQLDAWQVNDPACALYKLDAQIYADCNGLDGVKTLFSEIYAEELSSA